MSATQASTGKMIKRNLGLLLGYKGTNYHGLQISVQGLPTIQGEIFNAFYKAGMIADSNKDDSQKLKWSSSSRTDKGVHTSFCVCSFKLLLDSSPQYRISPTEVQRWNSLLPSDIRILQAFKLSKNARINNMCNQREYEYLIPVENLNSKPLSELKRLLRLFEGTHRFHNFSGALHRDKRLKSYNDDSGADSNGDENTEGDSGRKRNADTAGLEEKETRWKGLRSKYHEAFLNRDWKWPVKDELRINRQEYVRTLYSVEVDEKPIRVKDENEHKEVNAAKLSARSDGFCRTNSSSSDLRDPSERLWQDAKKEVYALDISDEVRLTIPAFQVLDTFHKEVESSRRFKEQTLYPHVAALIRTKKAYIKDKKTGESTEEYPFDNFLSHSARSVARCEITGKGSLRSP
eukprot:758015-Hanusia_phi.AAC.2